MKTTLNNQRGSALLITLAIMIMLTIAALIAVNTATTDVNLSFNQLHHDQAFYVAEAGINRAFMQINQDTSWTTGYANESFDEGTYWVAVVDSTVNPALDDSVVLRATSIVDKAVANVEAWLAPGYKKPFDYALFAKDTLQISNNTCTDSYNSDSGSYASTQLNEKGDVGSNTHVDMFNSTSVGGDAVSAGTIYMDRDDAVLGDTASGIDPFDFGMVDTSLYAWAEGVSMAPAGFTGWYNYNPANNQLTVNDGKVLTLAGGVYFFSDIELRTGGSIQVQPGEQAIIYMTGDLTVEQWSSVNPGGKPIDMQFYSTGSNLFIGQSAEFRATFWGEDADVLIRNNTEVYGSIVSNTITLDNHACFHYDRNLSQINLGKTGEFDMVAWREM